LLIFTAGAMLGWLARCTFVPDNPPLPSVSERPSGAHIAKTPAIKPEARQEKLPTKVDEWLQSGAYAAVLDNYETLMAANDDDALQSARARILAHAAWLLARQQHAAAQQLLKSFLILAYRDVDARILLAAAYLADKRYRSAIDQYYEAKGHAYQFETIEHLNDLIRAAVANEVTVLSRNKHYSGLLELYRYLTQLEPDYAPYFIGLAKAQLALNDTDSARRSLQLVTQDADVGPTAQTMLEELQPVPPREATASSSSEPSQVSGVALHRQGQHFLVDSKLGAAETIRLLIDTGASMTIVTPEVIEKYAGSLRRTGRTRLFNTANGPVRAPIFILGALTVGDWRVRNLEVGVLEMGGRKAFDGLLGMNFLKEFQFFIDQNEGVLRLSPN